MRPEHALEENYWIHVELFPETASQYSAIAVNELLVTFLHARAGKAGNRLIFYAPGSDRHNLDALTSDTPTFPYTANQCQEFIELLQRSKGVFHLIYLAWPSVDLFFCVDHASSPYITTYVARLWATVGKFSASSNRETFMIFLP